MCGWGRPSYGPPMRFRTILPATLLAAGLLAGCGGGEDDGGGGTGAEPIATAEVAVVDNDFDPAAVVVEAGTTVTWTWEGDNPHDVRGDGFASEIQTSGEFRHTFDEPGDFAYRCTVHPAMRGRVVVE